MNKPFDAPLASPQASSRLPVGARGRALERRDPRVEAVESVLSKLTRNRTSSVSYDPFGGRKNLPASEALFDRISTLTAGRISDSRSMMQILPDLKLSQQILVSSILSPNDMQEAKLQFVVEDTDLDSAITGAMLDIVTRLLTKTYKISEHLAEMLDITLFDEGAYPLVVMRESSIDQIINGDQHVGVEALSGVDFNTSSGLPNMLGLLGDPNPKETPRTTGLESLVHSLGIESLVHDVRINDDGTLHVWSRHEDQDASKKVLDERKVVQVSDNPELLKYPRLRTKMVNDAVDQKLKAKGLSDRAIERNFYKERWHKGEPVQSVNIGTRPTIGRPMVMRLPTESVIPIHVPGNPRQHVGYYVMLDTTGNPVSKVAQFDFYNNLSSNLGPAREMVGQMLSNTKMYMEGNQQINMINQMDAEGLANTFSQIVENSLLRTLRNGVYGNEAVFRAPQEIYRIMMARTLANQQTVMLFVPANMMTYMAFDYNVFGVGKSLLEDTRILGSSRAMLHFADVMAKVKNSISRVKLKIGLDPKDPDPQGTVEFMIHNFIKNKGGDYPLGSLDPRDTINYLGTAGIMVETEGHEGYGQTKFEAEDFASQKVAVDAELTKDLRNQQNMGIGVPPEMIDESGNTELATTTVSRNILFSKRVRVYQKKFCHFLTDHVKKYINGDGTTMEALRKVVTTMRDKLNEPQKKWLEENDDNIDGIVGAFLNALHAKLPEPNTVKLETLMAAFQKEEEAIDKALEYYFDEAFKNSDLMGTMAGAVDAAKAAVKAEYLRGWMLENGMMTKLADLTKTDRNGKPVYNLLNKATNHNKALSATVAPFIEEFMKLKEENDKKLSEAGYTGGGGGGDLGIGAGTPEEGTEMGDDFSLGMPGEGGGEGGEGDLENPEGGDTNGNAGAAAGGEGDLEAGGTPPPAEGNPEGGPEPTDEDEEGQPGKGAGKNLDTGLK